MKKKILAVLLATGVAATTLLGGSMLVSAADGGNTAQARTLDVTVHSVHSNVAKIHSRLPAAMEFWLVCLGILAYSCQNTSRDSGV